MFVCVCESVCMCVCVCGDGRKEFLKKEKKKEIVENLEPWIFYRTKDYPN